MVMNGKDLRTREVTPKKHLGKHVFLVVVIVIYSYSYSCCFFGGGCDFF